MGSVKSYENIHKQRKLEHLQVFFEQESGGDNGLSELMLEPVGFPELNLVEIETKKELFGRTFGLPLLINAVTGGIEEGDRFNFLMAELAEAFSIPMAVGSQSIGLKYEESAEGFRQLRKRHEGLFLIGNLSAAASMEQARRAVEMVGADALQLHLNIAQELAMSEGDRDFKGLLENIDRIACQLEVPVIVKETGFGVSEKCVLDVLDGTRAAAFDVSGKGGTNFVRIENQRTGRTDGFLEDWGIRTYESVRNGVSARGKGKKRPFWIIASGGIRNAEDSLKALLLGADFIGVAGSLLRAVEKGGFSAGESWLEQYRQDLKKLMLLIGKKTL